VRLQPTPWRATAPGKRITFPGSGCGASFRAGAVTSSLMAMPLAFSRSTM